MNTRIEKDYSFLAALHFNDKFYVNNFDITVSMLVETESVYEQNIAMLRSIYLVENLLHDSILISSTEKLAIDKYRQAGLKVCELPDEPYDHLVATILLLKFNAIMENRMTVTDIILSSYLSDGVRYNVVAEIAESIYPRNVWYNKPCPAIENIENAEDKNVVKLFENKWLELGLDWKQK